MRRKSLKSRRWANFCHRLPLDLLAEVLGRLPAKTLLKFRCVCKEWRSLIDSPNFSSLHLTSRLFLIERSAWRGVRCSIRRCDTFRNLYEVTLPMVYFSTTYRESPPMSYAKGLVLFSRFDDAGVIVEFILWNRSIRISMDIPPSRTSHCFEDIRVALVHSGREGGDYKIVVIPFHHRSWTTEGPNGRILPPNVLIEVYSLSTGSWTSSSIDTKCVLNLRYLHKSLTSLNGAVHWLGFNPSNDFCIVKFDVQNNVFHYFSLPDGQDFQSSVSLYALGESLALLKSEKGHCLIWVMKQYGVVESWVNQFKIDSSNGRVLYLMRNGKLFLTITKTGVKVRDIETGEEENLAKCYSNEILFMDTFVETLALRPK